MLGNPDAIVTIHGGTHRDDGRRLQALFRSDPDVRVLVATDAAGEGGELQNANYGQLRPRLGTRNRLEQRLGRIHRIGQTEVCHLWIWSPRKPAKAMSITACCWKLEVESQALHGRVFDILGEVFEETSLKDLLVEAIRYGDRPEVRARLTQKIDKALDHDHLKSLLNRNALAQETMSADWLFAARRRWRRREARRLQPYFVRAFFTAGQGARRAWRYRTSA